MPRQPGWRGTTCPRAYGRCEAEAAVANRECKRPFGASTPSPDQAPNASPDMRVSIIQAIPRQAPGQLQALCMLCPNAVITLLTHRQVGHPGVARHPGQHDKGSLVQESTRYIAIGGYSPASVHLEVFLGALYAVDRQAGRGPGDKSGANVRAGLWPGADGCQRLGRLPPSGIRGGACTLRGENAPG